MQRAEEVAKAHLLFMVYKTARKRTPKRRKRGEERRWGKKENKDRDADSGRGVGLRCGDDSEMSLGITTVEMALNSRSISTIRSKGIFSQLMPQRGYVMNKKRYSDVRL